jgi:hypothetical protein
VVDSSLTLRAEVRDANGRALTGFAITWTSSDLTLARVDSSGHVVGRQPGATSIRAVSGSLLASHSLRVVRPALGCGATHRGVIDPAGDIDLVRLPASAGDFITISLVETSGFSTMFQTVQLTLLTPTLDSIARFGALTRQDIVLPATGTYLMRLSGAPVGATGTYAVNVACLSVSSAARIAEGDLARDTLTQPAEVAVYTFSGNAGAFVALALIETSGFATMFAAPQAQLYGPGRDTVAVVNSARPIDLVLPADGPYLVRLGGAPVSATGAYALAFEGLDPPSPDSIRLAYGTVHSGQIVDPAEIDIFTINAVAGETIVVTLTETGGFATQFAAPAITIYTPSRDVLTAFNAGGARQLTLLETGRYVLRVNGAPIGATGSYNLGIVRIG